MRNAPNAPPGWKLIDRLSRDAGAHATYIDLNDNAIEVQPRWDDNTGDNDQWIVQVQYNDDREPRYDIYESLQTALSEAVQIARNHKTLGTRGSKVPTDFDFSHP